MTKTHTSEMMERVARAMDKSTEDWAAGLRGCSDVNFGKGRYTKADCFYLVMARAAIEAMRDPTQFMLDEAGDTITVGCCNMQLKDARDTWLCMIDAAL